MAADRYMFTSIAEIRAARPMFDETCGMTFDEYLEAVGDYHLPEECPCQFVRTDKPCKEGHLRGWVVKRKDGKELLVGGDCAKVYLNANMRFRADKQRYQTAQRIESHIKALNQLLQDKPALEARWIAAIDKANALRSQMRRFEEGLPRAATGELEAMVKSGNWTVFVEFERIEIEKDEQGREKRTVTWPRRGIGNIAGVSAWDRTIIGGAFDILEAARLALAEVAPESEGNETRLRKWRDAIEALPRAERMLVDVERAITEFSTPQNLVLVTFFAREAAPQVQIAQAALRLDKANASEASARDLLKKAHDALRQQNNGGNFRIAY